MFQTTNQHLIYWWYTFQRTNRPYHELGVGSSFPRKLADCWGLDLLGWQWESTIHFLCLFQANMVPAHPCFGQTHICYIIMFLVEMPNAGVTVPFSRRPFSLANPWVSMSMSNFWKVEVHSNSTNPLLLNATFWVYMDTPFLVPKPEALARLILRNTRSLRSSQGQCSYNLPMLSLQQPNPCHLKRNPLLYINNYRYHIITTVYSRMQFKKERERYIYIYVQYIYIYICVCVCTYM